MKTWRWFQSRVVNVSVAALLALPMGAPPVAAFATTDQLRPDAGKESGDTKERLGSDLFQDDTGKTFIAVTVPDMPIQPEVRVRIDRRVRGVIGSAFGKGRAFEFGAGFSTVQTDNKALSDRLRAAYESLLKAGKLRAHERQQAPWDLWDPRGTSLRTFRSHRTVILATDDDPSLLSEGDLHLIGSSGSFDNTDSHYIKLALIEGARQALSDTEADDFLWAWVAHELAVLDAGGYVEPPESYRQILNEGFAKIREYQRQQAAAKAEAERQARIKAAEERAKKLAEKVQLVPYLFRLGHLYADGRVPDAVVSDIQQKLAEAKSAGWITDARVRRYGGIVSLQVTYNGPSRNPAQDHRMLSIVAQATGTASDALPYVTGDLGFNEREAEPIYMATALGGHVSAFNLPIAQIFLREAPENQQKIEGLDDKSLENLLKTNQQTLRDEALREGPGYVFVIEKASDILAGTRDRTAYFLSTQQAPYINTLVHDQTEWVITKVLPRPGTKLYDPSKPPLEQDPIAAVAVDRLGTRRSNEAFSPVFLARQQSGSPAVGEFVAGTAKFFIAASGPNGAYHNGVVPVTEEEADSGAFADDGRVKLVAVSYQSFAKGHIPEGGARDQVGLSSDILSTRDDQRWVHDALALHGTFQPHTTAPIAMARAEEVAHELGARYHEIPAAVEVKADGTPVLTPAGKAKVKLDPVLAASNAKAVITASDLKADIGGEPGHQVPPDMYYATLRASLKAAQREGLIKGYDIQGIGDDMHIVIFQNKGVDDAEIHTLAWHSFFRSGWVLKQINYPEKKGYQPYGFMQDLVDPKVAKLIKEGKLEAFANLTDGFLEALEEEIQAFPAEAKYMPNIRAAYEAFKKGKLEGTVIEMAFSGNVRGQGIGFAEIALPKEAVGEWSVIASDKTGPGSFNFRTYWATHLALAIANLPAVPDVWLSSPETVHLTAPFGSQFLEEFREKVPDASGSVSQFVQKLLTEVFSELTQTDINRLRQAMRNGVVYELWDVRPNTRAFVDAQAEDSQVLTLLSATNEHNIKRLWAKKRAGWINDLTADELAAIDAKVDAAEATLLEELRLRQSQVKAERAQGKKSDQLTPWEQQLDTKSVEELLPVAKDRMRELLKVQEFLADDYFMSASTEKLAVAGGGAYLGKDDPTGWFIEPLAKMYRAMAKVGVNITLGNARGSHWVAVRPESRRTNVAVKWSNPIEGSIRFAVNEDGSVPVDEHGRAVSEDMYAGAEYNEARARVARFNEIWINTQGGFTPHGPNIEDVEAAYPYAATVRRLTRADSPFAKPVTDTTLQTIMQGVWADQFGTIGYQPSDPAAVARLVVDAANPKVVVLHQDFFAQGPDGAIAIERFLEYVKQVGGFASLDEAVKHSAVKLVVAMDVADQAAARQRLAELVLAVNAASVGATHLKAEWFEAASGVSDVDDLFDGAIGPSDWLKAVGAHVRVALESASEDGTVSAASSAFFAAVEKLAAGELKQPVAAKLEVQEKDGIIVPKFLDVNAGMRVPIARYQETVGAV